MATRIEEAVLTGDADYTVVGEMFTALERLGRPVRMVYFPRDWHPPVYGGDNLIDYWKEVYAWMDRYNAP